MHNTPEQNEDFRRAFDATNARWKAAAPQWKKETRHISEIKAGDTIEHAGQLRTVTAQDIKAGFMGRTIFGDSYRLGQQPVIVATPQEPAPCPQLK
jgi:hypothetical protein